MSLACFTCFFYLFGLSYFLLEDVHPSFYFFHHVLGFQDEWLRFVSMFCGKTLNFPQSFGFLSYYFGFLLVLGLFEMALERETTTSCAYSKCLASIEIHEPKVC